jgi:hypothetical protein
MGSCTGGLDRGDKHVVLGGWDGAQQIFENALCYHVKPTNRSDVRTELIYTIIRLHIHRRLHNWQEVGVKLLIHGPDRRIPWPWW